eukprot:TRINITY_DN1194_c0_g1_i2.p1 TRINITY_DN1194_c0_g1~~TRINITY_DN1194_c0_g1_i2.p1  ORF type:complete len:152 (+),score=15.66 TRINITY_DN1194_c0_g1_i2:151-606(+)
MVSDDLLQATVLQLADNNITDSYMISPPAPGVTLGITLPVLVLLVKNVDRFFSFEVQVQDDQNFTRRFRASNYQSVTRAEPHICTMPLLLDKGWNFIQIDLEEYTNRVYRTRYAKTLQIQVHANTRIRRIFFAESVTTYEQLLPDLKLYSP